jgi:hypothetical protein
VLGAIIRELCYPANGDLGTVAVRQAIDTVNAQIEARNRAERARGVTNKAAFRPLVDRRDC